MGDAMAARLCLAMTLLFAAASPVGACSPSPIPMSFRYPSASVFIGTPRADTLRAGPGTVKFGTNPEVLSQRRHGGSIYGQLVHVDRVGQWTKAYRDALRASANEVVIVPWELGGMCEPLRWTFSARWMTVGRPGLYYDVTLRPRPYWVGGKPTFDVLTPGGAAYTDEPYTAEDGRRPAVPDTVLTPSQMLDLYLALPVYAPRALLEDTLRMLAPLRKWERENPSLARRQPAFDIIRNVRSSVEATRARVRSRGLCKDSLAATRRHGLHSTCGDG